MKKLIKEYFAAKGHLSKNFLSFEYRKAQQDMSGQVLTAFENRSIFVCEAETGTGKTFAYLIPAIEWSTRKKERILISTNTINLQEQIFLKDIPALSKLDLSFKVALLKGMGNYLCLLSLKEIETDLERSKFFYIEDYEKEWFKEVIEWSRETTDGSIGSLPITPRSDSWEKISTTPESCLKKKCPHFEPCYYFKKRRAALEADIIITNHALLFADLSIRAELENNDINTIFPPYQSVIIDEAHHIEEVASKHFGLKLSWYGINHTLGQMQNYRRKDKGFLPQLQQKLLFELNKKTSPSSDTIKKINKTMDFIATEIYPIFKVLVDSLHNIGADILEKVDLLDDGKSRSIGTRNKIRLTNGIEKSDLWQNSIVSSLEKLNEIIILFIEKIRSLKQSLEELDGSKTSKPTNKYYLEKMRINSIITYLKKVMRTIKILTKYENPSPYVKWVEIKDSKRFGQLLTFECVPLDVGPLLQQYLYKKLKTIVATSATLTVGNNFSFFKSRTGLDAVEEDRLDTKILKSPFDYQKQALIAIPSDIHEPSHPDYFSDIVPFVLDAVTEAQGNSLLLFTSYQAINIFSSMIEESFLDKKLLPLKQGDLSRNLLINRFKESKGSVLMGTDSFWEGIDIKGERLKLVIIFKLPFQVPTEPLYEARIESIKLNGGNSFKEYTLPFAVIKFKQGMGRLIRSKKDRGAILVLDPRLLNKSYANVFFQTFPCAPIIETRKAIIDQLEF